MTDDQIKKTGAVHLSDADFQPTVEQAQQQHQPLLVDFYADWCGPCQLAAPVIDKLAVEYQGKAQIVKVNVDENRATSAQYGVMSIPTVIVIKDGQEVDRQIGFPGEEGYRQMLSRVIEV